LFAVIAEDTRLAGRYATAMTQEGDFDVERIRITGTSQEHHFLRFAALLGEPNDPPACAHVVRQGRYAAIR
jgi:hypothetical protein